jgi:hypothetical protein
MKAMSFKMGQENNHFRVLIGHIQKFGDPVSLHKYRRICQVFSRLTHAPPIKSFMNSISVTTKEMKLLSPNVLAGEVNLEN